MTEETYGAVEKAVRADVGALMSEHPMGEALAEMVYNLARRMDLDTEGVRVAALNRELRETLRELAGMGVGDDDDLDSILGTPAGGGLPAPVRDEEEPG